MGHYKSNLRDLEFNLFEVFGRQDVLGTAPTPTSTPTPRARCCTRWPASPRTSSPRAFIDSDRNPPVFDPADVLGDAARVVQEVLPGLHGSAAGAAGRPRRARRHGRPAVAALGHRRDGARRQPGRHMYSAGMRVRQGPLHARQRRSRRSWPRWIIEKQLGRHDGADRARRRLRRRRRPHQGRRSSPTAPGTSPASSASSPPASTTWSTTSSTSSWPGPRAPAPAPRACRCSSSRSSTSTSRPASSASATAPTSPTSSTRWASRSPPPAR